RWLGGPPDPSRGQPAARVRHGRRRTVSAAPPRLLAMTRTGLILPPDQPPERLRSVAHRTETAGIPELWLWEDCFAESGVAPAAAVLAWTERLQVGIGLLPVPLRNVALTALELATLARMFPDRLLPGIGHGVLDWMGEVGARAASPLTLLEEYGSALRRLLDGETVTTEGRYVTLEQVGLRWPPARLPVYVGAIGPKTLAVAGRVGDGVILTSDTRDIGEALATGGGRRRRARRRGRRGRRGGRDPGRGVRHEPGGSAGRLRADLRPAGGRRRGGRDDARLSGHRTRPCHAVGDPSTRVTCHRPRLAVNSWSPRQARFVGWHSRCAVGSSSQVVASPVARSTRSTRLGS